MKPSVELSIGDGVARVTLSRPDRGNAVDLALAEDLRAALVSHDRDLAVERPVHSVGHDAPVDPQLTRRGTWRHFAAKP